MNIRVTSISKTRSHVDIQVRNNVVLGIYMHVVRISRWIYEGNSISKLQIVIEKNRMEIMTYKQHLFFNIISTQI
jgi:hypothetical protein